MSSTSRDNADWGLTVVGRDGLLLAVGKRTVRSFGEIVAGSDDNSSPQEDSSGSQCGLFGGLD